MTTSPPNVRISHVGGYQFLVDFGGAFPALTLDEPQPIGAGAGPSPEQVLTAAVANCLTASLFFALTKHRQSTEGLEAEASCRVARNAGGRLRVEEIEVAVSVSRPAAAEGSLDSHGFARALAGFQDFCTVSKSVEAGIPVKVTVRDQTGTLLQGGDSAAAGDAREPATTPEDLVRLFIERANAGDVDGLVALYEPAAVLAIGKPVAAGEAAIRQFCTDLLARKSHFDPMDVSPALEGGGLALTVATGAKGNRSLEVSRRQPDGSWRFVLDQLKLGDAAKP